MNILPKAKFLRYQSIFHQKVMATPYTIELEVVRVSTDFMDEDGGFSLEKFVGDSPRTSTTHKFKALYEKEISDRTREKYGLPREVNGIVYLSPKQLVPVFGDYHLDWNTTKIHFEGRVQVVNKIVYLEELYNSCVGVQIFVRDDNKGG